MKDLFFEVPSSLIKIRKAYIILDKNGVVNQVGTTPLGEDSSKSIEVEITNDDIFNQPNNYRFVEGRLILDKELALKNAKNKQDYLLNEACQAAIYQGFDFNVNGEIVIFPFNKEEQAKLQEAMMLFESELLDELMWTVKKDGVPTRVMITKEMSDDLSLAALMHISHNISTYRNVLLPLVMKAETIEEVEKVTWNIKDLEKKKD